MHYSQLGRTGIQAEQLLTLALTERGELTEAIVVVLRVVENAGWTQFVPLLINALVNLGLIDRRLG